VLALYALYHLSRPAGTRPAVSSAIYSFFALCMDIGLVPFYILTSLSSRTNYTKNAKEVDRWTSLFSSDSATNIVLETTWILGIGIAGLHIVSAILDIMLGIWFCKIAKMPADMNPLMSGEKQRTSKHKYKNSEVSDTSTFMSQKNGSTYTTDSFKSITPKTPMYEIPSPTLRQSALLHDRQGSDAAIRNSTAKTNWDDENEHHGQSRGYTGVMYDRKNHTLPRTTNLSTQTVNVLSPLAGHSVPLPPGQDRNSFIAARPISKSTTRSSDDASPPPPPPPPPHVVQDRQEVETTQRSSLMRNNSWESRDELRMSVQPIDQFEPEHVHVSHMNNEHDSEHGDRPMPLSSEQQQNSRSQPSISNISPYSFSSTPSPVQIVTNNTSLSTRELPQLPTTPSNLTTIHLAPHNSVSKNSNRNTLVNIRRQLTTSSSIYSSDDRSQHDFYQDDNESDASSIISSGTAREHRYKELSILQRQQSKILRAGRAESLSYGKKVSRNQNGIEKNVDRENIEPNHAHDMYNDNSRDVYNDNSRDMYNDNSRDMYNEKNGIGSATGTGVTFGRGEVEIPRLRKVSGKDAEEGRAGINSQETQEPRRSLWERPMMR